MSGSSRAESLFVCSAEFDDDDDNDDDDDEYESAGVVTSRV